MIVYWWALAGIVGVWAAAVIKLGVWREWHHEYIGVAVALLPWWPAKIVGLLIALDDAWQHVTQLEHPAYLSPLHRTWDWVVGRF